MTEKQKLRINSHQQAIYLLNNTINTDFSHLLKDLPLEVPIFLSHSMAIRYQKALHRRRAHIVCGSNHLTFRKLLRALNQGNPVFVYLDVDQEAFQLTGVIAYKTKTSIIPLEMRGSTCIVKDTMMIEHPSQILPAIQSYIFESYQKTGVNLFNELIGAAAYYGHDSVICKDISGQITYKNLLLNTYVLSQRLMRVLDPKEDRIGVLLPNSIGNAVTLFALFYAQKTPVLLNFSAGVQTLVDTCKTAQLSTVLTSREFIVKGQLEALEEGLKAKFQLIYMEDLKAAISLGDKVKGLLAFARRKRVAKYDASLILFTSGSEYSPKGVVLSHDNIYANIQQTKSVIDFGTQDKMLNSMPMFHSFGLTAGAILPLLSGLQTYLYPSPLHYKRIPELAAQEGSTIVFGTSSFLEKYGQYADKEDFRTVRYAVVGAERLKPEVEKFWLKKFGLQILQGYGATETAPIMSLDTPLNHKQGSVGRFLPGIKHALEPVEGIQEGGKLLVQGPNVMTGYLIHGKGFIATPKWYDTGDIVTVDDYGFVTIVGRLKRFAKIAGEMISLNLVEQIAAKCYDSTDFAAINVPDERRGEKIILVTTLENLSLNPFQKAVDKQGYSRLHIPSQIRVIDELPLHANGKINYVALTQQMEGVT